MRLSHYKRRGYVTEKTPIEPLAPLSRKLGGEVELYIKRDDLLPGMAGGNKTRKLDFCIADAISEGADTLITCGAVQSNHCRLTLAMARKEGLGCHIILEERVKGSFHEDASGNHLLFRLMQVDSLQVVAKGSDMKGAMESLAAKLRKEGKKPYIIPGGASNPLGALGYAACGAEILSQSFEMQLPFDHIVVPSGSGGTHAGMVAGMYALNSAIPITGISVSRGKEEQTRLIQGLADLTLQKLIDEKGVPEGKVSVLDGYVGDGYSLPTAGMVEAVSLFASLEGVLVDPVYSGKAAAGLIDMVRGGYFPK